MEGFKTFTQAVDYAAEHCSSWVGIQDGTVFSYKDMMGVAIVMDSTTPLEEPFWYVVFPDGEIDYLSTETKIIDKIFLANNNTAVPKSELIGFSDESEIPDDLLLDKETIAPKKAARFCRFCGNPLEQDSVFCAACGRKL